MGWASASCLETTGSSISSGSVARTRATRSRMSLAAASTLRLTLKRTVIWLLSARLIEVMTSMPSMPDSESSSGLVTWDSMISALAPGKRVSTVTTGSSMFGYSRIGRRCQQIRPTSSTIRLSTVANTGRLMQRSARNMSAAYLCAVARRHHRDVGTVADLHLAGGHHGVAGGEAVADLGAALEALADGHLGEDGLALDDLEDELVLADRHDRLLGHQDGGRDGVVDQRDAGEQAGAQPLVLVGQRGAYHDGAALLVDQRIDGVDRAAYGLAGQRVDRDIDRLPETDLAEIDFGHAEIHLQRIDRLELEDGIALGEILADADRAQAEHAVEGRGDHR